MDQQERRAAAESAREIRRELETRGVRMVAVTWVDNSGIPRVKAVPTDRLESAAAWGIGASVCFDTFLFNDLGVTSGAVGDLRLHPDLRRLTVLAAQPGWAWAPADRYQQSGAPHPGDQRLLAQSAMDRLSAKGYSAKCAFEVEWVIGADADDFEPAMRGPAYGNARLVSRSDYVLDLAVALAEQGVAVDQIHPEYSSGQFEVSVAAADPVAAADDCVLVKETIRAVSARHGVRVSFSPKVVADGVGNGGHVHFSLWEGERNLFAASCGAGAGGARSGVGVSFAAGVLRRMPALLAVGAPSVVSYLRLVPQHWAGAYQVWGEENREAALRFVAGASGSREWAANFEVKCFDLTANPYLVVAGLIFAGLAGVADGAQLPAPVDVDPALLDESPRLPSTLGEAVTAFESDAVLREDFGEVADSMLAVRKGEIETFAAASAEQIVKAMRWIH